MFNFDVIENCYRFFIVANYLADYEVEKIARTDICAYLVILPPSFSSKAENTVEREIYRSVGGGMSTQNEHIRNQSLDLANEYSL